MPAADHEISCGYYTVSADGTVLDISDTALALFGRHRDEMVNRLNIAELLKPESRERGANQMNEAAAGRAVSPVEVEFLRADGSAFPAVLSVTPRLDEGAVRFTVLDLSRMRQSEKELRQSKDYLDNLFRSSNASILVLNSRSGVVRSNGGFEKLSGYKQSELFGRPLQSLLADSARGLAEPLLREAQESVSLEGRELPVLCKSGEVRTVVWNFSLLKSEVGQPPLFLAQGVDITDRKRAEGNLQKLYLILKAINKCNEAMIFAHDEKELLDHICRILAESGGYRLAWVGYAEQDGAKTVHPVAQFGYEEGYLDSLGLTWADGERGRGPTGTAIRTGKPVAAQNILTDPHFAPWRENALKRGYASSLAVPLRAETEVLGAVNVYSPAVDAFDEDEVILLEELAAHLAHVITFLRAREQRRMLSEALRQTGEAVVVTDREQRVRFANTAFAHLFGAPEEEADWRSFSRQMGVPEQAQDLQPDAVFEAVARDGRWEGEVLRRGVDGGAIPVYLTMAAIRDESGQVEGYVLTYADLRQIEAMQLALRDSEEKFRQISASAQDAILMMDDLGRISYWNPAAERIFGFSAEEAVGQDLHQLIVPEPYHAAFEKGFRGYLETGEGAVIGRVLEVTALRQSGVPFPVELSISSTLLGGRRYAIAILRDVSERKRAEEALKQLNATLEQRVMEAVAQNRQKDHLLIQQSRLAAMGEMVHNIAHQWRQPLNALGLQLANLRDEYTFGELTPELLDQDIANANRLISRMSTTIDDFRNFFRPSRERARFSLAEAVDDAIRLIEASLRHEGIALRSEWDDEVFAVGHANEFSQVVLNLLSNAKEALQAGGTVSIRVWREGKWGKVAVRDDGKGIPDEVMPKIFDPYFTTKEKGTGIGLYMSKKIVENMGGEIVAANVPEGGAEFTVTLPLAEP